MRTIPLIPLSSGKVALVDDADYELVSCFKWRAVRVTGGKWYAETRHKEAREFLHRLIMQAGPADPDVDHANGNGLDNRRRRNLRWATAGLNQANKRPVLSQSGFKGVTRRGDRWRAYITINQRFRSLGSFPTAEEAARAYDRAAVRWFNEYACTNADLGLLPRKQGVAQANERHGRGSRLIPKPPGHA